MPEDYQVPTALSVWVAIQEEVRNRMQGRTWRACADNRTCVHFAVPPVRVQIETLLQDYLQDPLVQAAENAERELANAAPQPGAHLRPGAHRTDGTKVGDGHMEGRTVVNDAGRTVPYAKRWAARCLRLFLVVCVCQHRGRHQHGDLLPRSTPRPRP